MDDEKISERTHLKTNAGIPTILVRKVSAVLLAVSRMQHAGRTVALQFYLAYPYSATSNNMKLVDWPLMGGLLYLVQRGGDWVGCGTNFVLFDVAL